MPDKDKHRSVTIYKALSNMHCVDFALSHMLDTQTYVLPGKRPGPGFISISPDLRRIKVWTAVVTCSSNSINSKILCFAVVALEP